ncbi:MAG: 2-dehydropantoate 2-reductase [Rhodospirillales bacterium]|nr:2-dehydropantoate 2-reductase [Rhodospirillales bacterium]
MKLLFLGAGATGGYFGGRLAAADSDVTFLVRPARAARMRDRPLRIESPLGNAATPVKAITGDGLAGASYDLVVLSCKAYDLDDAIAAVRPAVGEGTRVLPVLNGLAHLDRLDAAFGTERVLGGLCQIASTLAEDGTVRHLNRTHLLVFGARTAEQRSFCEALLGEISGRGFDVQLSDDIGLEMWEKWVLLATLAAVTCLMRAPIGDIVAAPGGEPLIGETLAECAAIATAAGSAPRQQTMARIRGVLTEPGSSFAASMLRDIEAGRRIEADHIIGDLIARAAALGVATPRLAATYCHLKAYESRRTRQAG